MGCATSTEQSPHAAVRESWSLKTEAERIFQLADDDNDGKLNLDELGLLLRFPSYAPTVMANMDTLDHDGMVSLTEWLVAQRETFDKSEVRLQLASCGQSCLCPSCLTPGWSSL